MGPKHQRCVTVILGQRLTKEQAEKRDEVFHESVDQCGSWLSSTAFPSRTSDDTQAPVRHGPVHGRVVAWHDELGWGVLTSPSVNGQVWVHFSNITGNGYRALTRGQAVTFTYETPGQDGYPHRATRVTRN